MSKIVQYNPNDSLVPYRIIYYKRTVNTPDFQTSTGDPLDNTLINPTITAEEEFYKFWKYNTSTGEVVDMTQSEKNIIDSIGKKLFYVAESSNGIIQKEIWYSLDNGDGTYAQKVEEIEYTFQNNKLITKIKKLYDKSENLINTEQWDYFSDTNKEILKKV